MAEAEFVVDYFHRSSPEHLEMLGVDPSRLPRRADWLERIKREHSLPIEERSALVMIWLLDDRPVGFSSCDKIVFGERANMHLHVAAAERRRQGIGTECVKQSVAIYFDRLRLKSLYCEPNAFNVGPNRTLQKAGFKYLKTHMTVPGPLNYHQAVTRWVIERGAGHPAERRGGTDRERRGRPEIAI
ncbi:MAG TPA: GNAT family N-acetyltransferase [Stellaceae bacterium]|nr:GNAT family N-acetyltransferase [Stellaceae bacterium]